ncbi:MAG: RlmE family RNA methyltransferase [Rickettsiales bacterium]|nr:RlmE family RNA methyltransferase [Rickettsiales bacterium]
MSSSKYQKGFRNKFAKVKTAKGRKLSSTLWIQRQINDPYNELARRNNYRSRAAFKLLEIDDKLKIIKNAKTILDLGCAPGGWLQILRSRNKKASIVGVDLLEIEPVNDCNFIQGDFLNDDIQAKIIESMETDKFDLILSDIAPNKSGHKNTDMLRIYAIAEEICEFAQNFLQKDGCLIIKLFMGKDFDNIKSIFKKHFKNVKQIKPESSRKDSSEFYIIGQSFI